MFLVKDKTGQEIFLRDRVAYQAVVNDLMGEMGEKEGYVIGFPSETMVEVQPLDKGKPLLLTAEELLVKDSLVQRVAQIGNNEEFQQLLLDAEARHQQAVAEGKTKPRTSKAKKDKTTTQAEVVF